MSSSATALRHRTSRDVRQRSRTSRGRPRFGLLRAHGGRACTWSTPPPRARTRRVRLVAWLVGALVVLALLAAVAFHVQLAQGQLELDRSRARRRRRAAVPAVASVPREQSSPAAIGYRAAALGMVRDGDVPTYLTVPDAPASSPAPDTRPPPRSRTGGRR